MRVLIVMTKMKRREADYSQSHIQGSLVASGGKADCTQTTTVLEESFILGLKNLHSR